MCVGNPTTFPSSFPSTPQNRTFCGIVSLHNVCSTCKYFVTSGGPRLRSLMAIFRFEGNLLSLEMALVERYAHFSSPLAKHGMGVLISVAMCNPGPLYRQACFACGCCVSPLGRFLQPPAHCNEFYTQICRWGVPQGICARFPLLVLRATAAAHQLQIIGTKCAHLS